MGYLASVRPLMVILDDPSQPFSHAKLMQQVIVEHAPAWRKVGAHNGPRGPIEIWLLE